MRIKWYYFRKKVFRPSYEVFAKHQKTLNVGKIRKYDEEKVLFRERIVFLFIEAFFYKNEKVQNMPEVVLLISKPNGQPFAFFANSCYA